MTLAKPPVGDPCNGCGLCCLSSVCDFGRLLLPEPVARDDRCPALDEDAGRFWCGLVRRPEDFGLESWQAAFVGGMLGIGMGCCTSGPGEPSLREALA